MPEKLASVQFGYDRWAAVYDHDATPLQSLEGPVVRAAVGEARGLSVLDVGCGTGRHSLWLAGRGAIVSAVDFSEQMLAEAKRKPGAESIRFISHDLHEPLPFSANTFDLLVCGLVLEHIRELDRFFAEMHRVLKLPGKAVISAMHPMMYHRGTMAQFTDPNSGEKIRPGSVAHSVGQFVMASIRARFDLKAVDEISPDTEFARQFPRAEKYLDWPMLVVLSLSKPAR